MTEMKEGRRPWFGRWTFTLLFALQCMMIVANAVVYTDVSNRRQKEGMAQSEQYHQEKMAQSERHQQEKMAQSERHQQEKMTQFERNHRERMAVLRRIAELLEMLLENQKKVLEELKNEGSLLEEGRVDF